MSLHDEHDILLLDRERRHLLMIGDGSRMRLPRVRTEIIGDHRWRAVDRISVAVCKELGLHIHVRRVLRVDRDDATGALATCAVVESDDENDVISAPCRWIAIAQLGSGSCADQDLAALCDDIIREEKDGGPPGVLAPSPAWEGPGWMGAARSWITAQVQQQGLTLAGPIVHERATFLSCVLRVPTLQEMLFFKVSCSLYPFEPQLTSMLSRRCPQRIPAPIAVDDERHWMLLHEARGPRLDADRSGSGYLSHWQALLHDIARLQQHVSGECDVLLALGCPAMPLASMPSRIAALLEELPDLIRDARHALSDQEWEALRRLSTDVQRCCADLAGDGIPASLVHGDFHSGNIRATAESCMIIDWAGFIAVTHPFLLLSVVAEELYDPVMFRTAISSYVECWIPYADQRRLQTSVDAALRLGPWYGALGHRRQFSIAGRPWEREQEEQNLLSCLRLALARSSTIV
jgi:hypothetical protein